VFADAVIEAAGYEGVEDASDLGVAPESVQGSWRDVDVGTGWGGDLLVVEEEHQLPERGTAASLVGRVADELLARARDAGVVRADVTEQDLALVPVMIGAVIHSARAVDPELWRRTLAIVLDGLRSAHHDPLPGTSPDSSQLARIIGGE
jgi:hypothetical protein